MGFWDRLLGRSSVAVVESKRDAPMNQDYRLSDDPPHIVRLSQNWPEGTAAYVVSDVAVAGISKRKARKNALACMDGENRCLRLERDPKNKYDPNAIAVIGAWTDRSGKAREGQIGWVPAEVAAEIARDYGATPLGARIRTMFRPRRGMSPGMRFDIGRPRARKR